MDTERRRALRITGAVLAGSAFAGCLRLESEETPEPAADDSAAGTASGDDTTDDGSAETEATETSEDDAPVVTVRGRVESATGATLDGAEISVFDPVNEEQTRATIENGVFEANVPSDGRLFVSFFHMTESREFVTDLDDVPVVYGLVDGIAVDPDEPDLGTYELPEGYPTQLQFVDDEEEPIEGLPANVRDAIGTGVRPGTFTTDAEGYMKFERADHTGVVLSGDVTVEIQPPGESPETLQQLSVTEEMEAVIRVPEPDRYR